MPKPNGYFANAERCIKERDELLKALRNLLTWAQNQTGLPDIALPMLHDDNPLRTAAELIRRVEER